MKKKSKKSKGQEELEQYVTRMLRTCYELVLPSYDVTFIQYCEQFNNCFHTRGLKDKIFKTIMKPVKEKLLLACYNCRNKVYVLNFENYQKAILEKLNYQNVKECDIEC